jgi:MFS family permease
MMSKNLRTFYILVLTQTFSQIGSQMSAFAIGIWVFTKTGDTTPLMLVGVFEILPFMLAGSLAGVLADRWNRKWLLILSDAGQAAASLFLLLSFTSGNFELWHLYLATLVAAAFGMIQVPTSGATITLLVPEEQRERANVLRQIADPAAGLVAPVVGGFLYAYLDVEGVILIDLLTFLVAVGVVSYLTIPQPQQTAEGAATKGSIWQELKGGLAFLRARPALLGLMFFITLVNFLGTGALGLATPYLLILTGNEKTVGGMLGIMNLGMILGGIVFGMWDRKITRMAAIMRLLIIASVVMIFYGVARSPGVLGLVMFLLLMPTTMINALFMSIFQVKVPPDMQGRVFALIVQIALMAIPLSKLITGPLIDNVLEPAVGTAAWWGVVAPIVGSKPGAGIGLFAVVCGAIQLTASLIVYSLAQIRNLEVNLPDYAAEVANEPVTESMPVIEEEAVPV